MNTGDELERASEREEIARQAAIKNTASDIPKGPPGNCRECGSWFPRLINRLCVPCRESAEKDPRRK